MNAPMIRLSSSVAEISPSLNTLHLLKWRDEYGDQHVFRLAAQVCASWKSMGILLGMTSNDLEVLEREYHYKPRDIWSRVAERWLAGGGGRSYPPTWEGLFYLLKDMELTKVAEDMEKAVAGYCPF